MEKSNIAFFDAKPYDRASFEKANESKEYSIHFYEAHLSEETLPLVEGKSIVCAFVNDTINRNVIEGLVDRGVKLVAMRCAGYNNVDLHAAYEKHLHVVRVPAYSPYAVAEHAFALMLTLNRKTHKAYARTRESNFSIAGFTGFDMAGKTIGVVGTGKIGRVLIDIAKGFSMNVIANDPYPNEEYAKERGITFVDKDTLYKESDIISLHAPLTKETQEMISTDAITKMKEGVMIINTSRGKLIDTTALIEGLKSRKVGSAGLDVYEEESDYFFEDFSEGGIADDELARLLTFPNVLITSHQAFLTKEALTNIAGTTFENIEAYEKGESLEHEICYRCDKKPCRHKEKGRCF